MSLNSQLSKEVRFAHKIFALAARRAGGYNVAKDNKDENIIIAGGAIRDLYFDRHHRDIDMFFDCSVISYQAFANELLNMDIEAMAREEGFEGVALYRGDGTKMGCIAQQSAGIEVGIPHEDMLILNAFLDAFRSYRQNYSFAEAVSLSHHAVPTCSPLLTRGGPGATYVLDSIKAIENPYGSSRSSASGSKRGSTHPLKSVEDFRMELGYDVYHIELMGIDTSPIEYMNKQFAVKLSRAYYDGHGTHFTPDFLTDARNKTLTVACAAEHAKFERLFTYYLPKMKHYFPDFEVKIDLNAINNNW